MAFAQAASRCRFGDFESGGHIRKDEKLDLVIPEYRYLVAFHKEDSDMAGLDHSNVTIVDTDDIPFSSKQRFAFVEGGQAYILNLLPGDSEEVLTLAPGESIEIPKSEPPDQSEDEQSTSIQHCFVYPPCEDLPETENVSLDDEQARAVASLLEFHNQMASPFGNSNSGVIGINGSTSTSVITPSIIKQESQSQEYEEILPHSHSVIGLDPLAINEPKKPPLKTYSRRGKNTEIPPIPIAPDCKIKQEPNVMPNFKGSRTPRNQKFLPTVPQDFQLPRRKRRCVVDAVKVIPTSEFKQQLLDTSDIVQKKIDCAPPNKKAMYYLTYGGVGKFFAYPGRKVQSVPLAKLFFSRLTMTTEPKSTVTMVDNKIEPLPSDLRTPGMNDSDKLSEVQSRSSPLSIQMFNDAVAKKTATSFDNFCKGMTKPPKYEYKRKKKVDQLESSTSDTPTSQIISVDWDDKSNTIIPSATIGSKCSVMVNGPQADPLEISDPVTTENRLVCTLENDTLVIKNEMGSDPQPAEIYVDANQDSEGVHSNFQMLIAAAEQHNSLNPAPDSNALAEAGQARVMEIKEEEDEDGNKTDVVYCTNEEVEQLIIFGSNGERYRVTTSTEGELTLWPEAECDTN